METMSRFLIADVAEILEATGRWSADRSGSIRCISSKDGWSEVGLYRGPGDRIHVVLSVGPGEDVDELPLEVRSIEARAELVLDPALGATRLARMILAAAGHLE